jgi:hypothetical protein
MVERIHVEEGVIIEKESFIDPFALWLGKRPTTLMITDVNEDGTMDWDNGEQVVVVDSGPGWVDVKRHDGPTTQNDAP